MVKFNQIFSFGDPLGSFRAFSKRKFSLELLCFKSPRVASVALSGFALICLPSLCSAQNWSTVSHQVRALTLINTDNSDQGGIELESAWDWRGSISRSDNVNTAPDNIAGSPTNQTPVQDFMSDQNFPLRQNNAEIINLRLDAYEQDDISANDCVTSNVTGSVEFRLNAPGAPGVFNPAFNKTWGHNQGNGGYFDATVGITWFYSHKDGDYVIEPSICPSLYSESYPASAAGRIPSFQVFLHAGVTYRFDNFTSDQLFDSVIILYKPDGYTEAASNDDCGCYDDAGVLHTLESRIDAFVPDETGVYYLELIAYANGARGKVVTSFSINMTSLDVTPPTGTIGDVSVCNYTDAASISEIPDVLGLYDNCTSNPAVAYVDESQGIWTYPAVYVRQYQLSDAFGNVNPVFQSIYVGNVEQMMASGIVNVGQTLQLQQMPDDASYYSFQWYDCSNGFTPIVGATTPFFTPVSTGTYALSCSYTPSGFCPVFSDCVGFVGVEETVRKELSLYPNPASNGEVQISYTGKVQGVRVYNLMGDLVLSENTIYNNAIDVSSLANGQYFVRVLTESGEHVTKLVIMN